MPPAAHPRQLVYPQNPTQTCPQTSLSNGNNGGLYPYTTCTRLKRAASRNEGRSTFLVWPRGYCRAEPGSSCRSPPARVCLHRLRAEKSPSERVASGGRGGSSRFVLALVRPGPWATFLINRGSTPLQYDFFLLPQRGNKEHRTVLHIYSLRKHITETFSSSSDVDLRRGIFPPPPDDFVSFFFSILLFRLFVVFSRPLSTAAPFGDPPPVLILPPPHRYITLTPPGG